MITIAQDIYVFGKMLDFGIGKRPSWRQVSKEQFEEYLSAFPRATRDGWSNGFRWRNFYGSIEREIAFEQDRPEPAWWINPDA